MVGKNLPPQYDSFKAAQERELDRILDDLEKEVTPDKGKALLDGIYKQRPKS